MRLIHGPIRVLALLSLFAPAAALIGCADDTGDAVATSCDTHFDCSAAKPYCRVTGNVGACLAPLDECASDDPGETDDGPAAARTTTPGTAIAAKSCTGTGLERDWYRVTQSAEGRPHVELTWSDAGAHFGSTVYDASGTEVSMSGWLPPGTYFIEVDPNTLLGGSDGKTAVAYEIVVDITLKEE